MNQEPFALTHSRISGYTWPEADAIDRWLAHEGIDIGPLRVLELKKEVSAYRIQIQRERDKLYPVMDAISDEMWGGESGWVSMEPDDFIRRIRDWVQEMKKWKQAYKKVPAIFRNFWPYEGDTKEKDI